LTLDSALSVVFFSITAPPPRSTRFPTRRSSDLCWRAAQDAIAQLKPRAAQLLEADAGAIEFGGGEFWVRDAPDRRIGIKQVMAQDRKSTRLNSSHVKISYAVFCLKKKKTKLQHR